MEAVAELDFETETVWLREYATTYLPSEAGFTYQPELFRRAGISIVDMRNAFRDGIVTHADKLDGPGALWVVVGEDGDGGIIYAEIVVISEELDVTVKKAERVFVRRETGNAA